MQRRHSTSYLSSLTHFFSTSKTPEASEEKKSVPVLKKSQSATHLSGVTLKKKTTPPPSTTLSDAASNAAYGAKKLFSWVGAAFSYATSYFWKSYQNLDKERKQEERKARIEEMKNKIF